MVFAQEADHLLLTRIVTQPDAAESFSIYNPTDSPIELNNYYICDDEEYYKMQSDTIMNPASIANGFTAKFPNIYINPGDTFHIVLNENYNDFYGDHFVPNLIMFGSDDNSMLETETEPFSSFGGADDKLNDNAEMLILFYWDEDFSNPIQDVDYFLWGNYYKAIDKSEVPGYQSDTSADDQLFFEEIAENYYAYSRIGTDELGEITSGGNGITEQHDETSENFRESWEIIPLFNFSFKDILNGLYDCTANSKGYCDSNPTCTEVTLQGLIVDYFDVTVYGGPHAITIEDEDGYRVEATIWPEEWDIASDDTSNYLITPPYNRYLMEVQGSVFEYDGEKQVLICSPDDFFMIESFNQEGFFTANESAIVQVSPAPFILLPSMGETLDFSYSFPENSRIIIRVLDLSGRFITSLVDKYYTNAGAVSRHEDSSAWDGRDQLGQIVPPGTYIMHLEVMNPTTVETQTDAAPIVVGVKN